MEAPAPGPREFATTRWSLVVDAHPDAAGRTRAREALAELCRLYWYPLYAFVRRRGHTAEDACDLVQSFFTRVVETGGFPTVEAGRGRFRSYLLGAMKHFLANERERAQARRRGGGARVVPLDALDAEKRYAREPAAGGDPDAWFDREWASGSVARALEALRAEWAARGNGAAFDALAGFLRGDEPPRAGLAARLGMTEGALRTAVHRLRRRYRALLRAAIAATVADPADVDDELRHLVAALRRDPGFFV